MPKPISERFLSKVIKTDGCWQWVGSKTRGYGMIAESSSRNLYAHRLSYELHIGVIPEGLFVLHKCDNPSCVNPAHLFIGNQKANMQDAVAKNRIARDERNGQTKLTKVDVLEIRKLRSDGLTLQAIADRFNISSHHVSDIARGLRRTDYPCSKGQP